MRSLRIVMRFDPDDVSSPARAGGTGGVPASGGPNSHAASASCTGAGAVAYSRLQRRKFVFHGSDERRKFSIGVREGFPLPRLGARRARHRLGELRLIFVRCGLAGGLPLRGLQTLT